MKKVGLGTGTDAPVPLATLFHLFLLCEQRHSASPGRNTNTGRRVVLVSLYCLSYLTVTCPLFPWFDSGYYLRRFALASVGTETGTHSAYCACFERFHRCSSWTRCARTSLCNDRCWLSSGHPCCCAEAVPHGPFHAPGGSSRTRLLMSFTIPLNGWTIAATATVVTSCSSLAGCPAAGVYASRCRVVVDFFFTPYGGCLRFCLGQCEADDWKIHLQLFPVP